MSLIHIVSAVLFIASAGLLILAERLKDEHENLSRKAALASLAAVFGAGVLFVMDVPQIGGLMNPWAKTAKAKKKGGRGSGLGEDEEEAEQDTSGGGGSGGAATKTAQAGAGGGSGSKAGAPGKGDGDKGDKNDGAGPPECEGCPNLIDIAPGSSMIGADAKDPTATRAEKPGRTVTIWPGFAISQRPISVAHYKRFLEATNRRSTQCPRPEGAPLLTKPMDPTIMPATCISYEDASAYAAWLSSRTGKVYRLPTAAQWEFVARGAEDPDAEDPEKPLVKDAKVAKAWPVAGMKIGVAEIVLDCWSDKLEVVEDGATGRNKHNCQQRVLKGAVPGEEERWQQPWARRPIPVAAHSLEVGFRIVRMN